MKKEELAMKKEELAMRERIEMRRMEFESGRSRVDTLATGCKPDDGESRLARSLKLVPAFDESKVTEWFIRFEKKALEFEWPRERWVPLVSNVLKGKALEAYDRMSVEELQDYDTFKTDILKAYELRPEAYRLQFRGSRKRPGDTYVAYARHLEQSLAKWIRSECVVTKGDLEELIIMEHFTNMAEKDIGMKIREKRFKTVKEAARWADDRVLASRAGSSRPYWQQEKTVKGVGDKAGMATARSGLKGYEADKKPVPSSGESFKCFNCNQGGHIKRNCPKLRKKESKTVALAVAREGYRGTGTPQVRGSTKGRERSPVCTLSQDVDAPLVSEVEPSVFRPQAWNSVFCHQGTVEVHGLEYPVVIARDTAAQVTILRNPTGRPLVSKEYVNLKGVCGDDFVPLVSVTIQCPVVCATGQVAVVESLPVEGVDVLLGNDLAGGKVFPSPPPPVIAAEECYPEAGGDGAGGAEMEDLYPVCAVTRSMTRLAKVLDDEGEQTPEPDPVMEESVAGGFCGEEYNEGETQSRTSSSNLGVCPPLACQGDSTDSTRKDVRTEGADCRVEAEPPTESGGIRSTFTGIDCSTDALQEGSGACTEGVDCQGSGLPIESDTAKSRLVDVDYTAPGMTLEGADCVTGLTENSSAVMLGSNDEEEGRVEEDLSGGRYSPPEISPLSQLPPSFEEVCLDPCSAAGKLSQISKLDIAKAQQEDLSLQPIFTRAARGKRETDEEEFLVSGGTLYRRWIPWKNGEGGSEEEVTQLVVPSCFRTALIKLAHEGPLAGHLGIQRTLQRLKQVFWWPSMLRSVKEIVKCCHTCQVVGKATHSVTPAPLHPIPAVDPPFSRVIVDIVGPLPQTKSGNKYLLTIMDVTTRYPEAIPIRSTHAKVVLKVLFGFFTKFGLPRELQSDRGVNFTSNLFKSSLKEWGIQHVLSSAYHPQSQGALERFHQTLKVMLRSFCHDHDKDWDQAVPYVLFAVREVPGESLGFSPNELVFGHQVRGPLHVVREAWGKPQSGPSSLLDFVVKSRERLLEAREIASRNLGVAQKRMKAVYDVKTQPRILEVGAEVLALLPVQGKPLAARYSGPYRVEKRVGELDFVIATPDRRKATQLCHVNMLKSYHRPNAPVVGATEEVVVGAVSSGDPRRQLHGTISDVGQDEGELLQSVMNVEKEIKADLEECSDVAPEEEQEVMGVDMVVPATAWVGNSREALVARLEHLQEGQREELLGRLWQFSQVFSETPGLTTWATHDIEVGESKPVKLPPYRLNPQKQAALDEELKYMLDNGLIKRAYSEWSSPVTLQPKPDGKIRLCVDFRKVNTLSTTDSFPLPRVDDSVDLVGRAKYITKVDLMKGYWQVPLTERAKKIASFVVRGAVYQCQVMPYGLKNAPATFQRLMSRVVDGIPHCAVYIDDVVIYDTDWGEHVDNVALLFERLSEAGLVVNLAKCDFVKASVQYLGFVVGHGQVAPPRAKVEAIVDFVRPHCRRELQRFLGMIGYYRRFIRNYSTVLAPLTDLLKKDTRWQWTEACEAAFNAVKSLLCNHPILRAPDFDKPFILAVDASRVGVGAVLMQADDKGVQYPVSYFSKKLTSAQRNYSTIEQELLAIVLALQHFQVYLPPWGQELTVFSDHHPLQFLSKFKYKNQRLTRWSLILQEYNLVVRHIKGCDNVIADCLSRVGAVA